MGHLDSCRVNRLGRDTWTLATLIGMNDEWMNDPKMFSDFYENLQKWSSGGKEFAIFRKSAKNVFYRKKNPNSSFKIRGFCEKKMFFKFAEILLTLSSAKRKFFSFSRFTKNFFNRKISQLQLSKLGVMWKKMFRNLLKLPVIISLKIIRRISAKKIKLF